MNTSSLFYPKPYVVAAPLNPNLCCKSFDNRSVHTRNVFSTLAITDAHSQTLFSHFASTKLNMSETDLTRVFKYNPALQSLQTLENVELVIHLLLRHGCSEVQITSIMIVRPQIFSINAKRILEPKIKLLEDFAFEGRAITELLTANPQFLTYSLEDGFLPKMEFFKNIFQSQDALVKALLRAPALLTHSLERTLKPSFAFWERWGFCKTEFHKFLQISPSALLRTSLTPAQADFIHKIGAQADFIHKIGVDKGSKTFKYVVRLVATSRLKTLEANIQNLQHCGLSAEETLQLVRVRPGILYLSKETISAKMNFVINNMGLPAGCVVNHIFLLVFSMEKIIKPSFLVWQKIKSIDDPGVPLLSVLKMSEANFVEKIIKGHPESKSLLTIYEDAISNASKSIKN